MFPDGRVFRGSFLDGVTGNVKPDDDIVCSGSASTVVYDIDNLSTQIEREFVIDDVMEGIISTIESLSMDESAIDLSSCFDDDDMM